MEHTMKLYERSFKQLKNGKKKREYRLNDDKRKKIKVEDTYQGGYYTKEESDKYGCVVFTTKKA